MYCFQDSDVPLYDMLHLSIQRQGFFFFKLKGFLCGVFLAMLAAWVYRVRFDAIKLRKDISGPYRKHSTDFGGSDFSYSATIRLTLELH